MFTDLGLSALLGPFLASVVGFALAFLLLAYVLRQHERQSASIAWLLAIMLVPVVGVPAYLLFAGRKLAWRASSKRSLTHVEREPVSKLEGLGAEVEEIMRGYDMSPASDGNKARLITTGVDAYNELVTLIDGATRTIHITTFILANDRLGKAIVARLERRAREGVEVRVLVDAIGSFAARWFLLPRLKRSGGHVGVFMRALLLHRRRKANLRNHRKLAIFDGHTAIAGGMNLGRQYLGVHRSTQRWVDTTMRLEGPVVSDLETVFADDWEFATDETLQTARPVQPENAGDQVMQVIPSGPDVPHDPLYDALVASVYKARERVWLVTPYFVPDAGLMRALTLQARLGSDVRVIMPRRSDNLAADMARQRYVRKLSEEGVRFSVHRERMIHAKHVLIDDALAFSGSANLDMRSLYLNYELTLLGFDNTTIESVQAWIGSLLEECDSFEPREPGVIRRFAEDVFWLAGPLL
jgi:cardiolipin synthase